MTRLASDPIVVAKEQGKPSLFIILRPSAAAYPIIRRMARTSPREHTGKDFIDFFGNVDVIVHFGPLTELLVEDEDRWRELIPGCGEEMDAEREFYTGGKAGQRFMVIYLSDSGTRSELPRWKELVRLIMEKFF